MAFNRSAAKRQLAVMKEMGANALRTSHNACDPQMLDLCDEMGIIVWNECFDKWNGTAGILKGQNLEEYVEKISDRSFAATGITQVLSFGLSAMRFLHLKKMG
jgi:beta-galactosidase/beta-glucuronidase